MSNTEAHAAAHTAPIAITAPATIAASTTAAVSRDAVSRDAVSAASTLHPNPRFRGATSSVRLGDLNIWTGNPRTVRPTDAALDELGDSILATGLLNPLMTRGTEVIAGQCRTLALRRKLERGEISADYPVVVINLGDVDDDEALEVAIVENTMREDMSALETIRAYRQLSARGLDAREIARRTGKDAGTVRRYLAIGSLEPRYLNLVGGDLTLEQAEALASAPTDLHGKVLGWIQEGMSLRDLHDAINQGSRRIDVSRAAFDVSKHADLITHTLFGDSHFENRAAFFDLQKEAAAERFLACAPEFSEVRISATLGENDSAFRADPQGTGLLGLINPASGELRVIPVSRREAGTGALARRAADPGAKLRRAAAVQLLEAQPKIALHLLVAQLEGGSSAFSLTGRPSELGREHFEHAHPEMGNAADLLLHSGKGSGALLGRLLPERFQGSDQLCSALLAQYNRSTLTLNEVNTRTLTRTELSTLTSSGEAAALDRAGLVALLSGTTVKLDLSGRPVSAGEQVHVALDGLPAGLDGAVAEVRALEALGDLQGALALTQESRFLTQRAGALASGLLDSGAPGSLSEDQLLDLFDQIQASGSTDPELLSLATLIEAGNFEAAAEIAANESVQSRMKTILAA